ncbi:MAG: cytochrome c [Nitrospiria bacterium]
MLRGRLRDLAAFTALGLGYTVVSEWVNVDLRGAWGYAAAMPRLPWIGTRLAPLMQWVLLPPLIAVVIRRAVGHERAIRPGRMIVAAAVLSGLFAIQANAHDLSKPPVSAAERANPLTRSETVVASGKSVYEKQCALCHGPSGSGNTPAASAFSHRPPDFTKGFNAQTDGELFWKVTKGGGPMPAYEAILTDEQRWQVIHYLRTLARPAPGAD